MNKKLAELILFVSEELADDRYPGFKVKLHKILCHADFAAYRARGHSITGEDYVHYENGPFLKAIDPTVAKLQNLGIAKWTPPDQFNAVRLEATRRANLSFCAEEEIAWVRAALHWARNRKTEDVIIESHRWFGWRATHNAEKIPYSTSVVGDFRALSADENSWALDLIKGYREHKDNKAEYRP